MPDRMGTLSSKPELTQYAQRIAAQRIRQQADFLAPTVEVANPVGRFKKYDEKNRFRVPKTRRPSGGRATEVTWEAEDGTYNCEYHGIDVPMDKQDLDAADPQNFAMESMDLAADIQALAHEKDVIVKALAAAGSGTDSNFASDSVDPISVIDTQILALMKATAGTMPIRIAFGPTAFMRFKHNKLVKDRFKVGAGRGAVAPEIITLENIRSLFFIEPEIRMFSMVEDTAAEGLDASFSFLMDTAILVFTARPNPTRYDPSFMKTFRVMGAWMTPRFYNRDDGRVEVAAMDWSEDVQVTNSTAVKRINANNS